MPSRRNGDSRETSSLSTEATAAGVKATSEVVVVGGFCVGIPLVYKSLGFEGPRRTLTDGKGGRISMDLTDLTDGKDGRKDLDRH
jgi:hypothetical protein